MHVSVYGAGYVGLVQAAVLADAGHRVVCADIDADKIEQLKLGYVSIYEPGLTELVAQNAEAGRLSFTSNMQHAVEHGALHFIAVGTPQMDDGGADVSYVMSVATTVARTIERDAIIVVKSTVPVGTCDGVAALVQRTLGQRDRLDLACAIAFNPEFLKEGAAIADCQKPDRIIIGTDDPKVEQQLRELYAPFNRNHEKVLVMDLRSAELTKYAANCMLATKISFINEIANLADLLGADIEHVRRGIGADPRIGYQFIYPGLGYGGSCFPKDVRALIRLAQDASFDPMILRAVDTRNDAQKTSLTNRIKARFGSDLSGRTFALWGLAFKPNTDDMREAPARAIMEELWTAGARVRAFDPKAMDECRRIYGAQPGLELCVGPIAAARGADALVVATEWKAFQGVPLQAIRDALLNPVIFDGRNIFDPDAAAVYGLDVIGVGRRRQSEPSRLAVAAVV
jgi:UDPglucose 6-dehydrogenase